jgi:integrase
LGVAAEVGVHRVPVPPEVIVVAVRWYLRFDLAYRDVEELLLERGIEVDYVTVYGWVQRFTPLLLEAARAFRRVVEAAGLDPADWAPRALRHSFVSLLSSSGVRIEDIANLCGHAGTAVTERCIATSCGPCC